MSAGIDANLLKAKLKAKLPTELFSFMQIGRRFILVQQYN